MTTPKVLTTHRGGSRYYIHPETGEKVPGVTSILNMLPKPFLKAWASKVVAETAVNNLEHVAGLAATDPAGAIDYLKRAPNRFTQGAADVGTAAHGIFEALAKGEKLGPLTADMQLYADHFAHFLDTVQPTYRFLEETVWSDTYSYAGSFDAFMEVQGEGCWTDNKTTKSGVHAETALQLAAYSRADFILDSNTSAHIPMPVGTRGLVVHVRPEGWALYEVPIGDEVFEHFLALRKTFVWDGMSRTVVGKPLATGSGAA